MDFADPDAGPRYEPLDPALLPPLGIAWRVDAAEDFGPVHSPLRARFARGEETVRAAMENLANAARRARDALLVGDREQLATCVDASFEARRQMMELDPRHVEMIEVARAAGASANYAGSGGAIVAA